MKKTRGLNDTAALQATPADNLQKHESRSTDVRKIENGFVVRESSSKDGMYESREFYSPVDPTVSEDSEPANPMRKAVDYMKRNGTL